MVLACLPTASPEAAGVVTNAPTVSFPFRAVSFCVVEPGAPTVKVSFRVVAPVTSIPPAVIVSFPSAVRVLLKVVAPVTPSVPVNDVA